MAGRRVTPGSYGRTITQSNRVPGAFNQRQRSRGGNAAAIAAAQKAVAGLAINAGGPVGYHGAYRQAVYKRRVPAVRKGQQTQQIPAQAGRNKATNSRTRSTNVGNAASSRHRHSQNHSKVRTSSASNSRASGRTNKPKVSSQGPRSSQHRAVKNTPSLQVGQYLVGKTIGQGTFGKVKLGVHSKSGEKAAIKILEKRKIVEVADVERVSREILILKRVGAVHDNVIRLYEVIDTPKSIYLIMEYCSGGELFDYIVKNGRIKEKQACNFFHQILNGVEYLHKCNVVHRDLKPENLLMERRPEGWNIKVVDFGLSNTDDGGKLLKTACGSPCYAAPEMIAGKKYVGPKADMWSLGVVLFALVCGFLPFEHDNTSELYKKILRGDYKCPKFISPHVKDLIGRILNTNPKQRFSIAQARRHPWMQMVKVKNIQHKKPHVVPRSPKLANPKTGGGGAQLPNSTGGQSVVGTNSNSSSPPNAGNILANIDQQVLRQCADLGFKPATVVEGLVNKLSNQATTAYHLLCSRKRKLAEAALEKQKKSAEEAKQKAVKMKQQKNSEKLNQKDASDPAASSVSVSGNSIPEKIEVSTDSRLPEQNSKPSIQNDTKTSKKESDKPKDASQMVADVSAETSSEIIESAMKRIPVATNKFEDRRPGARRVVAAAIQDRSKLAQAPQRPSIPKNGPSAKSVANQKALHGVALAPMSSADAEGSTTEKVSTSEGNAWRTPRVDGTEPGNQIKPSASLLHDQEVKPVKPKTARPNNDTALQPVPPPTNNGAQTSRPTVRRSNVEMSEAQSSAMDIVTGVFNVEHTSSKSPEDLLVEIKRVLDQAVVKYEVMNRFQFVCHKQNTRFKIEVCKRVLAICICLSYFSVRRAKFFTLHSPYERFFWSDCHTSPAYSP